jgi:hypothetical protein
MFCHSITKMVKKHLEQHYAIKFFVILGKGNTDPLDKIQKSSGNDSVSHAQVFGWYINFVVGQEMVKDEL